MSREKNQKSKTTPKRRSRDDLPTDLDDRLRVVWRRLGHAIEWCDAPGSWIKMFHTEPRLYRQVFYWEAVTDMVADYMLEHPQTPPGEALTDCLVATQHPPSDDESDRITAYREMWDAILCSSQSEIEAAIQSDLDLAMQEGTLEIVARLYAADCGNWRKETEI